MCSYAEEFQLTYPSVHDGGGDSWVEFLWILFDPAATRVCPRRINQVRVAVLELPSRGNIMNCSDSPLVMVMQRVGRRSCDVTGWRQDRGWPEESLGSRMAK